MSTTRLVLEALRWLTGGWLLWRIPRCRPAGDGADRRAAATSVVIPARDEEATLPRLLASLAAQRPPPARVIVVDDHSGDDTAGVGRRAGALVVAAAPLPPGWTGKNWACAAGADLATTPTLAFLDADAEFEPGGLARVLAEHERRGGLVSVAPDHVTLRPYERLSAFFNLVAMMGLDAFDPRRGRRPPRGAFGPCLVTSADEYRAVGGHRAVRAEVVDDVALAARYTAAGRPVTCLGGRGTIRFRMYPRGLGQLVEGWTKNFAGAVVCGRGCARAGPPPARRGARRLRRLRRPGDLDARADRAVRAGHRPGLPGAARLLPRRVRPLGPAHQPPGPGHLERAHDPHRAAGWQPRGRRERRTGSGPVSARPLWTVVAVDAAAWALVQVGAGYVGHRLPDRLLEGDGRLLSERRWERGGRFYVETARIRL